MKNKSVFYILFLVFLFGCQTSGRITSPQAQDLDLHVDLFQFKVSDPKGTPLQTFSTDDLTIHTSTFLLLPGSSAESFIQRRMQSFLTLFEDERDPYTQKLTPKSKCLLGRSPSSVSFMSGEGKQWSNCSSTVDRLFSERIWIPCNDKLWEITVQKKNSAPQSISGTCPNLF